MTQNNVQPLIQQLYENESLTNALTDDGAKFLLEWGETQLNKAAILNDNPADTEDTLRRLQRVLRAVNRVVELKNDLTDEQLVQRLLTLVERAMDLAANMSTPSGEK